MSANGNARWEEILRMAVTEPGTLSNAFKTFYGYSIGNQMAVMYQCAGRGLKPGPIASYKKWQEIGRQVRGGEKAMHIWIPMNYTKELDDGSEEERMYFAFKPVVFVMSQTDGENEPEFADLPDWNIERAMAELGIELVEFDNPNGNVLGFARKNSVAINPLADPIDQTSTLFHEVAHVVCGHTQTDDLTDKRELRRDIVELEAEGVALILSEVFELGRADQHRGYIQNWWGLGNDIPEKSARKIFSVAEKIIKAGRETDND